ncbi:response regulator [Pedobacter sp. Hv1]|uniref:hybrid sensor histidine kinase/response regulator n=1 Tax=Pedobacter sp. Hv1 TaxID=1740090 RepID=UPI00137938B7|nr:response regulator [Pedobacter sp. Hv1]
MNKDFIHNLEKISSSAIRLAPKNYISPNTRNFINVDLDLKDWQDNTISKIHFERAFNLNFNNTKKILGIILIATILNLLIYLFYYRRWIYKPLKLITNSLETKDENSMSLLKKSHGEFVYIGNLFEENNNQRKQLEIAKQKAEESDNLKSAFLANLSHEIRTPMNAIIGFSDLLNDEKLSHSDKTEYLEIIRKSGKNLISIIEDLLEMSKIDSKQITPNYTSLDLDKCISEVYNATRVTIPKEKSIAFAIVKTTKNLKKNILMDETKLKQILTNLLTNAIKFTISGHINIGYAVNEETKLIKIWVEDSGLGIDKANTKLIFDRFRRVEDDFSIELSGLGLGLSITKAYIELLGGAIDVKSAPGVGSTFTLNIPLIYDESIPKVALDKSSYQTEGTAHKTILVAEDDDINFLLLEKILRLKNYHVIRAVNGKVAVDLCKDNLTIDLIFMDIKMPIMNGFEAFKMIRTFNQTIPIIANTAYSSPEDKERIMNAGFTDYLSKPLNKEKIFEVLDLTFGNS